MTMLGNVPSGLMGKGTLRKKIAEAVAAAKGVCPRCGKPWADGWYAYPFQGPASGPLYLEVHPSITTMPLVELHEWLAVSTRGRNTIKNMVALGVITDISKLTFADLLRFPNCGRVTAT